MYTTLQAGAQLFFTPWAKLGYARLRPCAFGTQRLRQRDFVDSGKATWMAGEGIQIFGGNGYTNEYPLGRIWRDAKLYEIGAGTSEVRRMLIGRELFNEPPN